MQKVIHIEGMSCEGCSGRIKRLLEKIDGVSADVSHTEGKAQVELSKAVEDALLISTIENAGYKVTGIE